MGFLSKLFGRQLGQERSVSSSLSEPIVNDESTKLAMSIVNEANNALDHANQADKAITKVYYLEIAQFKIELLEYLLRLNSQIKLTSLSQIQNSVNKFARDAFEIRKQEHSGFIESIANSDLKCPTCGQPLLKMPKRKVCCKECGVSIYPRKNPVNQQMTIVSEEGLKYLKELEFLLNDNFESWLQYNSEPSLIAGVKKDLASEWKIDASNISDSDAKWRLFSIRKSEYLRVHNWDGYCSQLFEGIRQLAKEGKNKDAIPLICEFIYLSYNVKYTYEEEFDDYAPLLEKHLYGPQLYIIRDLVNDTAKFRMQYEEIIDEIGYQRIFGMPPEDAFRRFRKDMDEYVSSLI